LLRILFANSIVTQYRIQTRRLGVVKPNWRMLKKIFIRV